jgi:hypothetical protein
MFACKFDLRMKILKIKNVLRKIGGAGFFGGLLKISLGT